MLKCPLTLIRNIHAQRGSDDSPDRKPDGETDH